MGPAVCRYGGVWPTSDRGTKGTQTRGTQTKGTRNKGTQAMGGLPEVCRRVAHPQATPGNPRHPRSSQKKGDHTNDEEVSKSMLLGPYVELENEGG